MAGKLLRCLMAAAFSIVASGARADAGVPSPHREAVDVAAYPWSSIGKLFNEAGGACTGVIVARDKILTAAHCIYNARTQRFLPASSLHFMVGYRGGQAGLHARVVSYEIGAGYDASRWFETMEADWAILTLTEVLPDEIAPLRLRGAPSPSGTRAFIAGYPQDRAHLMTADMDCELSGGDETGRLFHTCRGIGGYSGAPILVGTSDDEVEVAGIHVATMRGGKRMVAVPAQSIAREAEVRVVAQTQMAQAEMPFESGWFE